MNSSQNTNVFPRVSIIIVTYNNAEDIATCLDSLAAISYPNYEIIVVDNASSDGSAQLVQAHQSAVKLISAESNLGFGGANNLASRNAEGDYLAFLNPDTTVQPNWLEPLVNALETQAEVGIVTAKILMYREPDYINTTGNFMHFTGFGYLRGWKQLSSEFTTPGPIFSISGAAFMISRSLYAEIGGFEELFYPAYVEDIDIAWRVRLAGYDCWFIPDSVIFHNYTLHFNTGKYMMLERHRQMMIVKNYRWRTLILLSPGILLAEIVTWGFALLSGTDHLRAKFRSYGWIFTQWRELMKSRQRTQTNRRIDDHQILSLCSSKLAYGQAGTGFAVKIGQWIIDPVFTLIHRLALAIIRW